MYWIRVLLATRVGLAADGLLVAWWASTGEHMDRFVGSLGDPTFWAAVMAIAMSGLSVYVGLREMKSFGEATHALHDARRSMEMLSRSNAHMVELLSRKTGASEEDLKPLAGQYHPYTDTEHVA